MPKRKGYLYDRMLDKAFIREVILKACKHRYDRSDVARVMRNIDLVVEKVKYILEHDDEYEPSPYHERLRFDESSQKYRTIRTVPFNPDCIIQWLIVEQLKSVFMKSMDYWCSASIPGRGGSHVYRGIKRFIKHHPKSAKYGAQADVRHYYDTIDIDKLMQLLRRRIKDERFLRLVEKVVRASSEDGNTGIGIGYNLNQWLANFFLEEIDRMIREDDSVKFYARYMDNMTFIGSNKRKLRKLLKKIDIALHAIGLELKYDWQVFPIESRAIQAVGYRYFSNGKTILRKRNWLKLRRQILRIITKQRIDKQIPPKQARAFMSRFGSMKKFAPSRRIFQMAQYIDFADLRRKAA